MASNYPHGLASWGVPVLPGGPFFPARGRVYWLDPTNGNDGHSGLSPQQAFKTLPVGYDALTANQGDVLYYVAGTSSISLSEQLVWDKDYTSFIGVCPPIHMSQRARIFQDAGDLDLSPLLKISADNCVFKNFYIFQGTDDAQSLINVQVTGIRNYFENVHFAGSGHATMAINGGASLNLNGSASENRFVGCTIGTDTIAAATGVSVLLLNGGTGDIHTTRNIFQNCTFRLKAGAAGAAFIEMMTIYDIDRDLTFENCKFINLATQQLTEAIVCPAGFDPADKRILMYNCSLIGAPGWDISNRGVVYGDMGTPTGIDLSGVLLQLDG